MRMMKGVFRMVFQGQECRCPMAGVRDEGAVEVAVATPFGLRRIHAQLSADRTIAEAHTFAFDYESGAITRFELSVRGGPSAESPAIYAGTVSGAGLEGTWRITEASRVEDDDTDAAHALGVVAAGVPSEQRPAPDEPIE